MKRFTLVVCGSILLVGMQQVDDLRPQHSYPVCVLGSDSIFFASLGTPRGFAFLAKDSHGNCRRIMVATSPYNTLHEFHMGDFDGDGRNDVLVVFGDEGFYDVIIYKVGKSRQKAVVDTAFVKFNVDYPPYDLGFKGKIVEIVSAKSGGVMKTYINTQNELGQAHKLVLYYSKASKEFILKE